MLGMSETPPREEPLDFDFHRATAKKTTALKIKRGGSEPPKVIIYGPPGVGKTTFLARPDALIVSAEDGAAGVACDRVDVASAADLRAVMRELPTAGYTSIGFDSITQIARFFGSEVAAEHRVATVEAAPYGKGLADLAARVSGFCGALNALRERGMSIVLVAHEEIESVSDPEVGDYVKKNIAVHRRARCALVEWADVIGIATPMDLVSSDGVAKAIGRARKLHFDPAPSRVTKIRAGWRLPATIDFKRATFDELIANQGKKADNKTAEKETSR